MPIRFGPQWCARPCSKAVSSAFHTAVDADCRPIPKTQLPPIAIQDAANNKFHSLNPLYIPSLLLFSLNCVPECSPSTPVPHSPALCVAQEAAAPPDLTTNPAPWSPSNISVAQVAASHPPPPRRWAHPPASPLQVLDDTSRLLRLLHSRSSSSSTDWRQAPASQ